jgi:hypothetical protein
MLLSDHSPDSTSPRGLPLADELRRAVELYVRAAYETGSAPDSGKLPPEGDFNVASWLMSDAAERTPPDAPIEAVRSFAMRLGNDRYPHMKLRLSRPPRHEGFVFSVDSHDAFLSAPPGTSDYEALEEIKRYNARLAGRVRGAFEEAGLPTEREYLREQIRKARRDREGA